MDMVGITVYHQSHCWKFGFVWAYFLHYSIEWQGFLSFWTTHIVHGVRGHVQQDRRRLDAFQGFLLVLVVVIVIVIVSTSHRPQNHIHQEKYRKAQQDPQSNIVVSARVRNHVQKDVAQESARRKGLSQAEKRTIVTPTRWKVWKKQQQYVGRKADQGRRRKGRDDCVLGYHFRFGMEDSKSVCCSSWTWIVVCPVLFLVDRLMQRLLAIVVAYRLYSFFLD